MRRRSLRGQPARGDRADRGSLRLKFALASAEYNDATVVIVLNVARGTVGVVVDAVSDVVELTLADR
jgi:hypothetical protein